DRRPRPARDRCDRDPSAGGGRAVGGRARRHRAGALGRGPGASGGDRMSRDALDAPVVIAGAGPVGLVLALELSHHGIRSILVERRAATTTFPKMDITNARSMELLARLGLADLVRSVGVEPHHSFDVIFASSLAGREFARWRQPSVEAMRAEIASRSDGSAPAEAWQRTSQEHVEAALMR